MEIKYKISEELKTILIESHKMTSAAGVIEMPLEVVIYSIIKYYNYRNANDVTSSILWRKFDHGADWKIELEKACYKEARNALKHIAKQPEGLEMHEIPFTGQLEACFERADKAVRLRVSLVPGSVVEINTEDLFCSMLGERDDADITSILAESFGIKLNDILGKQVDQWAKEVGSRVIDNDDEGNEDEEDEKERRSMERFERAGERHAISSKRVDPNSKTPALDQFALNMTARAKDGGYDPVVGRNKEIEEIIEILCCRKKNNACLLGDPGCGKTSVVESLAQRIASGNVPRDLRDRKIFSLDLNALVSGTQFRGQFEERLQNIIKEVIENKNIIIYIDEMHNLIGSGSSSGSGDAANILKPYLARGEFQCIGSTTTDEYRKHIEKDGALKRRFSPVYVKEPSVEETKQILRGISEVYSKFHHVTYPVEVLDKCVEWSGRYISDRYFPDKAIGILDMASSVAKLRAPQETKDLDQIEAEIKAAKKEMSDLVAEGELEKGQEVRSMVKDLEQKREEMLKALEESRMEPEVSLMDLSNVISKASNVPVDKIMSSDISKLRHMKERLETQVIGQDEAVQNVTMAFQRNILGLRNPNKPLAAMLFVGPTGVGKSYITKKIAEEFMGSTDSLVTISCSEYMQEWAESKLLGSAPGYVGYSDSEPRLYVLKRKPYSVLLIDEVEKSSKNLYNIWLNMLEEGEITLSTGEKVSCRNCIIIFTGNIGTKSLELKGNGIGFGELKGEAKKMADHETVMKEVRKEFRPEFLNRLSDIIVFNSLGKEELNKIFHLELQKLKDRLDYELEVTDRVQDLIVGKCEPKYGARSLQRFIVEHIEKEICSAMLTQDIEGKKHISVDCDDTGKVQVQFYA